MNTGDKVWFLTKDKKYIANILEVAGTQYVIAYFCDNLWTICETTYDNIFPRQGTGTPHVFELYDTVLVKNGNEKSFGVVIGFELGIYVVVKYAKEIWRRVVVPGSALEHHENTYDQTLFDNRRQLLADVEWIKWFLP